MIKSGLPSIHPGEFLAEILEGLGMSQAEFSRAIGVSPMRVSHVIKGSRPVTAELAYYLAARLTRHRSTGSICRPITISRLPRSAWVHG